MFGLGSQFYLYLLGGVLIIGAVVVLVVPLLTRSARERRAAARALGAASPEEPGAEKKPFWRRRRDSVREIREAIRKDREASREELAAQAQLEAAAATLADTPAEAGTATPARLAEPVAVGAVAGGAGMSLPDSGSSPEPLAAEPAADGTAGGVASSDSLEELLGDLKDGAAGAGPPEVGEGDEPDEGEEPESGPADASKEASDPDSLFSLFTAEVEEQSDASKLAAMLNEIEAADLLTQAQELFREMNWRRAGRR